MKTILILSISWLAFIHAGVTQEIRVYKQVKSVDFPNGFEIISDGGKVVKRVEDPKPANVKAYKDVKGVRYYMSDWSWEQRKKGKSANWMRGIKDTAFTVKILPVTKWPIKNGLSIFERIFDGNGSVSFPGKVTKVDAAGNREKVTIDLIGDSKVWLDDNSDTATAIRADRKSVIIDCPSVQGARSFLVPGDSVKLFVSSQGQILCVALWEEAEDDDLLWDIKKTKLLKYIEEPFGLYQVEVSVRDRKSGKAKVRSFKIQDDLENDRPFVIPDTLKGQCDSMIYLDGKVFAFTYGKGPGETPPTWIRSKARSEDP